MSPAFGVQFPVTNGLHRFSYETASALTTFRLSLSHRISGGTHHISTSAVRATAVLFKTFVAREAMAMRRAGAACPDPADHGGRNRDRATRRLRRLARALSVLVQAERSPTSARNCNAMAKFGPAAPAPALQSAWKRTAAPQLAGRDVRLCLAARALSGMLCDEPNAARCRTVVRSWRSPTALRHASMHAF